MAGYTTKGQLSFRAKYCDDDDDDDNDDGDYAVDDDGDDLFW